MRKILYGLMVVPFLGAMFYLAPTGLPQSVRSSGSYAPQSVGSSESYGPQTSPFIPFQPSLLPLPISHFGVGTGFIKTVAFSGAITDSNGNPVGATLEIFQNISGTNNLIATMPIDPVDGTVSAKVPVDLSGSSLSIEARILDLNGNAVFDTKFGGATPQPGAQIFVLWLVKLRFQLRLDPTSFALQQVMVRPTFVFP